MKIALIGYGKMGKMIEQIAKSRHHDIVSIIDVNNPEDFDTDAFQSADVAIEFTAPTAAYDNVRKAFDRGVKVVSGSTGWMNEHAEEMRQLCETQGKTLFWASNFSVGVAIFSAVNHYLAQIMNNFPQYDVTMEETHHIHKLDAPSGTAITLANDIVSSLDRKAKWVHGDLVQPDGSVVSGEAISETDLPIKSIRCDEVPGIHSVIYDSEADKIQITHDAHSRQGFALGAVLAAEYTHEHQGFLTIDDLFNFPKL